MRVLNILIFLSPHDIPMSQALLPIPFYAIEEWTLEMLRILSEILEQIVDRPLDSLAFHVCLLTVLINQN